MKSEPLLAILESIKPYDNRIPIHPNHFNVLNKANVFVQAGYAGLFHETDATLKQAGFHLLPRDMLLKQADILFILKPLPEDLKQAKIGATIIGWCHAIQHRAITQIAVQRKLTLIAMEDMHIHQPGHGMKHVFHENNFMAGYAGVAHALEVSPVTYNKTAKIAVISYGAVSQGAVSRLLELDFRHITVFSRRHAESIPNKKNKVNYCKMMPHRGKLMTTDGKPLSQSLIKFDVIVNGIMQDV